MRKSILAAMSLAALLTIVGTLLAFAVSADTNASMQFGRSDLGTGCSPAPPTFCLDDQSFHSVDKIEPGSVKIAAGDAVDFLMDGFHQVAIYEAGTKKKDIDVDLTAFPFVNDSNNLILLGVPTVDETNVVFAEPGKYLVICNIAPHFVEAQMWGWVIVK